MALDRVAVTYRYRTLRGRGLSTFDALSEGNRYAVTVRHVSCALSIGNRYAVTTVRDALPPEPGALVTRLFSTLYFKEAGLGLILSSDRRVMKQSL